MSMGWGPRDHARQLRRTVSIAYVASVADVPYHAFLQVAAELGFEPVEGRLARGEVRAILGLFLKGAVGFDSRERIRTSIDRFADDDALS